MSVSSHLLKSIWPNDAAKIGKISKTLYGKQMFSSFILTFSVKKKEKEDMTATQIHTMDAVLLFNVQENCFTL